MIQIRNQQPLEGNSYVGQGCTFNGDVSTEGHIRIDGVLNGNIKNALRLILGRDGVINGNSRVQEAEVMGKVNGNLVVSGLLCIHEKAEVKGNIDAAMLRLEMEATYNGYLRTGKAVASMRSVREKVSTDAPEQSRRIL